MKSVSVFFDRADAVLGISNGFRRGLPRVSGELHGRAWGGGLERWLLITIELAQGPWRWVSWIRGEAPPGERGRVSVFPALRAGAPSTGTSSEW